MTFTGIIFAIISLICVAVVFYILYRKVGLDPALPVFIALLLSVLLLLIGIAVTASPTY